MDKLNFSVAHIGVNCADAAGAAQIFTSMFGIPADEGRDSIYSGPLLELMKTGGRGTHGHIGIATDDIHAARAHFEAKGIRFAEGSEKYDDAGNLIVVYFDMQVEGFAIHLLQKSQ